MSFKYKIFVMSISIFLGFNSTYSMYWLGLGNRQKKEIKHTDYYERTKPVYCWSRVAIPLVDFFIADQKIAQLLSEKMADLKANNDTTNRSLKNKRDAQIKNDIAHLKHRRHLLLEQALNLGYNAYILPFDGRLVIEKK